MDEIHGEVSSADASGGADFTLYPSGSTTARTLQANEYLVIKTVSSRIAAEVTALVAADADAAGERAAYLDAGVNNLELCPPYVCPRGEVPRLIASGAGQVDVTIQGYIKQV